MSHRIQYCLSNTDHVDHSDAKGHLCLQQCGLCYESAFVVVNGETRAGESHERLIGRATGDQHGNDD